MKKNISAILMIMIFASGFLNAFSADKKNINVTEMISADGIILPQLNDASAVEKKSAVNESAFSPENFFTGLAEGYPFTLNPVADSVLLTTGAALTGLVFYMDKTIQFDEWDGNLFDADSVNAFDRWAMQPYNKTLHKVGTATCAAALVSPVLFAGASLFDENFSAGEFVTVGTMYLESFLLSYGIKDITKRLVKRARPYMYFEGYPEEKVADFDYEFSFPSGHTTNAFLGATFTTCMMAWYFPDSQWRIPVTAGVFAIAAGTGVLRMMSGNHFLTDVLTGAAIGSFCGFIVPFIHNRLAESQKSSGFGKDVSLTVLPVGFAVSIAL